MLVGVLAVRGQLGYAGKSVGAGTALLGAGRRVGVYIARHGW